MQRQSLGSPSSNHHHHHHHLLLSSAAAVSPSPEDAEELKPPKKLIYKSPNERLIHLIPLLALLCFLVLYLSSHRPSQFEMAEFNKKLHKNPLDSVDEIDPLEMNKGDIVAIRSLRNLQEIEKEEGGTSSKYQQLHRKIGEF